MKLSKNSIQKAKIENHFKKNFILETRKTINKEQELKEEKSEFDINKNF